MGGGRCGRLAGKAAGGIGMTKRKSASHPPVTNAPSSHSSQIIGNQAEFAKLQAQLVLAGFACRELEIGGYFVSNETSTFYCAGLRDLEIVLEGMRHV